MSFSFRNIKKEPPTDDELQQIVSLDNFTIKELVNKRGQTYKKLKPDLNNMSDEEVVKLIQENPSIMVRPILTDGHQIVVGFKEAAYQIFMNK
ncbi:MAG: transcriptional regulator [Clostridia bacterium]|nr:transcriptional regulator [Clostridia bacterium]